MKREGVATVKPPAAAPLRFHPNWAAIFIPLLRKLTMRVFRLQCFKGTDKIRVRRACVHVTGRHCRNTATISTTKDQKIDHHLHG
jgi:hypothetical protein